MAKQFAEMAELYPDDPLNDDARELATRTAALVRRVEQAQRERIQRLRTLVDEQARAS